MTRQGRLFPPRYQHFYILKKQVALLIFQWRLFVSDHPYPRETGAWKWKERCFQILVLTNSHDQKEYVTKLILRTCMKIWGKTENITVPKKQSHMLKLKIQRGQLLKVKERQQKSSSHSEECECHAFDVLQIMDKQATASSHKTILAASQKKPASQAVIEKSVRKTKLFFPISVLLNTRFSELQ